MNVAIPQYHLERKVNRSSSRRSTVPLVGALHPSSVGPGSLGNRTLKTNKQDPSYELKILRFSDMNSNFSKNANSFNIGLNRVYCISSVSNIFELSINVGESLDNL